MTKIKTKSIIDEIKECKGYDVALFTTYNIDLDFFENQIKSILLNNKIRDICLFVDSRKFNQDIKRKKNFDLGKQYFVYPMDINAAFHPKVILLLGKGRAKLFVSSANLKVSSYRYNSEVFNSFDYTDKKNENSQMIKDAINMFLHIQEISNKQLNIDDTKYSFADNSIVKYLKNYLLVDSKIPGECVFLNNLDEPIIEQIETIITSKVKKIRIASPFYDSNLSIIKKIISTFDCNKIDVYVQNISNRFPVEYNNKNKIIPKSNLHIYNGLIDGDEYFYHGKVIEFICKNNSYILYGSPNCTTNALLKTYQNNGNIETAILCNAKENDFDYFFNSFDVDDDIELESKFEVNETEETQFMFVYGQLENDIISLYIKTQNISDKLIIKYNDKQLKFDKKDGLIIAYIPIDIFSEEKSIFSVSILDNKKEYILDCWFNNYKEITYFRQNIKSENNNLNYVYEDENEADYYNFVMEAHRIMASGLSSNPKFFYESSQDTSDADDVNDYDDEDYDYVLDDPTEDNYVERNNYSLLKRGIKSISSHYFKSLLMYDKSKSMSNERTIVSGREDKSPDNQQRGPISSIKKLGRYIKRLTNHYLIDVDDSNMPVQTYIDLSGLVLNNIEKYFYSKDFEDLYKGFLTNEEVVDIKCIIAKNILKIAKENPELIENKIVLTIVLDYITEFGYFYKDSMQYDEREDLKRILIDLDKLYNIRDDINEVMDNIKLSLIGVFNLFDFNPKFFVDELFGYKSHSQLMDEFYQKYGNKNVELLDDGKTFMIQIDNCDLSKCNSLPVSIVTRIADNLYQSTNNYQYIRITYKNKNQYITYNIGYVKKNNFINGVVQEHNLNEQTIKRKCVKRSNAYMPDIFN